MLRTAALVLLALSAPSPPLQLPPESAFTVLERQPDGPRITPYLTYQIDMAWRQDERRRARFATRR